MMKIGFIGAGKMAQALAKGFIAADLTKGALIAASCAPQDKQCAAAFQQMGAESFFENTPVIEKSDIIVLAVKPQVAPAVLAEISSAVSKRHLLLSVAMGVTLKQMQETLAEGTRVIRTMPNTPCLVGAGASVFTPGATATADDQLTTVKLLTSVGTCHQVPESLMDVATALSGSGPAYVYLMIESLADGAVKMGMPRDLAYSLAAQTVLGAGQLVLRTSTHPAKLKDDVMSPAGSTAAGVHFLEKHCFRATVMGAVEEATIRCKSVSSSNVPPLPSNN